MGVAVTMASYAAVLRPHASSTRTPRGPRRPAGAVPPTPRRAAPRATTRSPPAVAATPPPRERVQQQQQPGGTFEFNLPGHGNVKASWSVADDEESRWLDRLAADAESSSSSASAAGGGGGHRIPFGDDSVKFGSDAYEFIADLLRQGTDDGEGEKPTGYWEKVDEEGSRMLDRIAANARHRAEANGDDDSIGGFVHNVFSGKSKQHGEEPSHVESDKEFSNSKLPPHDDM